MGVKRTRGVAWPDLPPAVQASAPNAGELDVLGVLWREARAGNAPLQLAEIHRRVCRRRQTYAEPEPALTTVSTHLRNLLAKGLIEELAATRAPVAPAPVRTRGGYRPQTRSPLTSYRALYPPGQVLFTTFYGLAEAYPPDQRLDALLDFARALGLPDATLGRLHTLIQAEAAARGHAP